MVLYYLPICNNLKWELLSYNEYLPQPSYQSWTNFHNDRHIGFPFFKAAGSRDHYPASHEATGAVHVAVYYEYMMRYAADEGHVFVETDVAGAILGFTGIG